MKYALLALIMAGYSEADLKAGKLPPVKLIAELNSLADCETVKQRMEGLGPVYVELSGCSGARAPIFQCIRDDR